MDLQLFPGLAVKFLFCKNLSNRNHSQFLNEKSVQIKGVSNDAQTNRHLILLP